MQTVSSTLAVALAEAEASQSRSMQITLSNELGPTLESKSTFDEAEAPSTPDMPSPKQSPFQTKRLRDAVSYQIGGHCFRVDDESSEDTPVQTVEDEHAKDVSLTRLQYVVTSVFGLREAARNRSTTFEHHASRLFMFSVGPNIVGGKAVICCDGKITVTDTCHSYSMNRRSYWVRTGNSRFHVLVQSRQSIPTERRLVILSLEIWERESIGVCNDINFVSSCESRRRHVGNWAKC